METIQCGSMTKSKFTAASPIEAERKDSEGGSMIKWTLGLNGNE